ncbi:hypothetical protein ACIBI4_08400 [Streptomyces sp. NPDC050418]|uniref:hypothetical protein n=1 Tax=Streptomyces sp. NPDC050418 TaxID=3365612 RepID=UPI0037A81837
MSFGQGGPQWGSGGQQQPQSDWVTQPGMPPAPGATPDWAALAEASESRAKRRRLLMVGGGALATVAVAAVVAIAVVSTGSDDGTPDDGKAPAASDTASTASQQPTFAETKPPPPPDPKDYISSADKDKAPLSAAGLFPGKDFTKGGATYKKGATSETKDCGSVTNGPLGALLEGNDCTRVLRATYEKDGVAVTVGVAVFDTEKQATKVKDAYKKGTVKSLSGKGVAAFCNTTICRSTTNSYGRYAYFTVGGFTSGKDVTTKDKKVFTAGDAIAGLAFQRIHQRGEAQASAAVQNP